MLLKPPLAYVKLSTNAVDNSVDEASVSIPSAGRAGQFCDLASFCATLEILNENMRLDASQVGRTRLVQPPAARCPAHSPVRRSGSEHLAFGVRVNRLAGKAFSCRCSQRSRR
jgi:hypothetical protein